MTIRGVPTAKQAIPQQSRNSRIERGEVRRSEVDLLIELDRFEQIPTLHCDVTEDQIKVRFRCGFCNTYHYHDNIRKNSPAKGHYEALCRVEKTPYPNGYYLRTDLDKIYRQLFPNFTVERRDENIDRHFEKCDRLRLPFCVVKPQRNYACFEVDFITVDPYGMNPVLGSAIREFREKYRASHPLRCLNRKRLYDGVMGENQQRCVINSLWLYVNDIYLAAKELMPIINDSSHWVLPCGQPAADGDLRFQTHL